jgi:hypothetical protein
LRPNQRKRLRYGKFCASRGIITLVIPVPPFLSPTYTNPSSLVHNFSTTKILSAEEISVLSLGFNFIPTPPDASNKDYLASFERFRRSARLFHEHAGDAPQVLDPLYVPNSEYDPQPQFTRLERALRRVDEQLRVQLTLHPRQWRRPHPAIRIAQQLAADRSITICAADKNLGVCVFDTEEYERLVHLHLDDANQYELVQDVDDIYEQAHRRLEDILNEDWSFHNDPRENRNVVLYLSAWLQRFHDIPNFYVTAKIHKLPVIGRPIAAAHSWITTGPSKVVSVMLEPYRKHRFIARNTQALIDAVDGKLIRKDALLFSLDVRAMYPSMRHDLCFAIPDKLDPKLPDGIAELMRFVLEYSLIRYGDNVYRQRHGQPMGTNNAPAVADTFMLVHFELHKDIYRVINNLPLYKRYLDDIVGVWNGTREELEAFRQLCNTIVPGIEFDMEVENNSINVLDVTIYKEHDPDNPYFVTLGVKTYQKALNKYQYPPASSAHHPATKRGFVRGELIRYVRNSTDYLDYAAMLPRFRARLRARGYSHSWITSLFATVDHANRRDYVSAIRRRSPTIIPWITRYSPRHHRLQAGRTVNSEADSITRHPAHPFNVAKIVHGYRVGRKLRSFLCPPRHKPMRFGNLNYEAWPRAYWPLPPSRDRDDDVFVMR